MYPTGAYKSEIILTGNTTGVISSGELPTPRLWTEYENPSQYALPGGARILTKSDLESWLRKYADGKITDFEVINVADVSKLDKLTTLLYNRRNYWLATARLAYPLYYINTGTGSFLINGSRRAMGIRVLVTLSSDIRFEEAPETIVRDGYSYNVWRIE